MSEQQQFGKWEVEKELSRNVFLVSRDDRLGALKIDRHGRTSSIQKEVEILEMLDHPSIIKLLDYDLDAERPYLVTEYHSSNGLSFTALKDWDAEAKLNFFSQYSQAIAYCHSKGIVKYDHKLGNILLRDDNQRPVIIDFGDADRSITPPKIGSEIYTLSRFFWEIMEGKRMVNFLSNPNIRSEYSNNQKQSPMDLAKEHEEECPECGHVQEPMLCWKKKKSGEFVLWDAFYECNQEGCDTKWRKEFPAAKENNE